MFPRAKYLYLHSLGKKQKEESTISWLAADSNIIGVTACGSILNPANLHLTSTLKETGRVRDTGEITHPDRTYTLSKCSIS